MKKIEKLRTGLIKKNFTVFLLWLLSKKEMCGYELMKVLSKEKGAREALTPSSIYPLLGGMLKEKFIKQRKVREGRRIKKFYKTTNKGLKALEKFKKEFFTGLRKQFLEEMLK